MASVFREAGLMDVRTVMAGVSNAAAVKSGKPARPENFLLRVAAIQRRVFQGLTV
jgi:hypothetical protein